MLIATVFNTEEWKELSIEKSSTRKHLLYTLVSLEKKKKKKTASPTSQTPSKQLHTSGLLVGQED